MNREYKSYIGPSLVKNKGMNGQLGSVLIESEPDEIIRGLTVGMKVGTEGREVGHRFH